MSQEQHEFLSLKEANGWWSGYLTKKVTPSGISCQIQDAAEPFSPGSKQIHKENTIS